jgi:flagella basal body P-ring formation protein FlgA
LRPHSEVASEVVTLNDIASVGGSDAVTTSRLGEMVLGPAPRAGETSQLSRQRIGAWLRRQRQLGSLEWRWAGAADVKIHRASQWVDGERVSAAARQSLEAWLRPRTSRFELTLTQPLRPLVAPAGELVFRAREPAQTARATQRMQMWVDIWADGRFIRTEAVSFNLQAFQPVSIAPMKLSVGQVLQEADIEAREIDLTTLAVTPWSGSPAAVERGTQVTVRSRVGGITVITTAQSLQAGNRGQHVRVKATGSSQSVAALVVEPHMVEVSP